MFLEKREKSLKNPLKWAQNGKTALTNIGKANINSYRRLGIV